MVQTGPEYILHCRTLGFTDVEITTAFKQAGWNDIDIHTAFIQANHMPAVRAPGKKSLRWLWILLGIIGVLVLGSIGVVVYINFIA